MILDRLENACLYRRLGARIAAAFDYLCATDFRQLLDGRYELDGDRLFAMVQRYVTRPPSAAKWEAHRQYVDVQYVVEGVERIGYAPLVDGLPVVEAYDAAKDLAFFDAGGDLVTVRAGSFAIFTPQDLHAPGLAAESSGPAEVRKVVVKCRVDALESRL
ncbi:MAG: YhcH/YjgK/YiaL family protein [Pirellulales bacterium]